MEETQYSTLQELEDALYGLIENGDEEPKSVQDIEETLRRSQGWTGQALIDGASTEIKVVKQFNPDKGNEVQLAYENARTAVAEAFDVLVTAAKDAKYAMIVQRIKKICALKQSASEQDTKQAERELIILSKHEYPHLCTCPASTEPQQDKPAMAFQAALGRIVGEEPPRKKHRIGTGEESSTVCDR